MKRFFRILKLRLFYGFTNCDYCDKFTNKTYSIPDIEVGWLVCKKCAEELEE